jgi:hypothetical protein
MKDEEEMIRDVFHLHPSAFIPDYATAYRLDR